MGTQIEKETVYDPLWDRPLGGSDPEKKQIPHWPAHIVWAVVVVLCKIVTRYTVRGRERLRALKSRGQGFVLACNHQSFLDIPFIWCCSRPSLPVRVIGRANLFDHTVTRKFLSLMGGVPIARDSADRSAVKRAAHELRTGQVVGIFPEGTRRGKSGRPVELAAGAALIARMGKAPIVPMAIDGTDKIKQKGDWRIHFHKVRVYYGRPIEVSWFNFLPKEDRLQGCIWFVMREVFALKQQVPAEQVDMAAFFPGEKDFTQVFAEHPVKEYACA